MAIPNASEACAVRAVASGVRTHANATHAPKAERIGPKTVIGTLGYDSEMNTAKLYHKRRGPAVTDTKDACRH
jgi:hypothetical protein